MLLRKILIVLLLFWILTASSSADMCSWVDKDGIRHFSNASDCPRGEGVISPEAEDGEAQADRNRLGLRYLGLYRDGIHYLRFYGDGAVVSVSSTGRPEQLASWFGKSAKNVYKGNYSIDNDTVRFYTRYKQNIVLAKGIVKEDVLAVAFFHIAKQHLNENNYVQRAIHYYTFIPMDFPRENRY